MPADEHHGQADGIEVVGLGASLTAIDLDTRGIDDDILNAVLEQEAMDPEAIATRLITALHRGVGGESEVLLARAISRWSSGSARAVMVRSLGF